jgi:hypothetical protein
LAASACRRWQEYFAVAPEKSRSAPASTGETWITSLDLFQMALQDFGFFLVFLVVVN